MHKYMYKYVDTYIHTDIDAYTHANTLTYTHMYIRTYIHIYIDTHKYTCTPLLTYLPFFSHAVPLDPPHVSL